MHSFFCLTKYKIGRRERKIQISVIFEEILLQLAEISSENKPTNKGERMSKVIYANKINEMIKFQPIKYLSREVTIKFINQTRICCQTEISLRVFIFKSFAVVLFFAKQREIQNLQYLNKSFCQDSFNFNCTDQSSLCDLITCSRFKNTDVEDFRVTIMQLNFTKTFSISKRSIVNW